MIKISKTCEKFAKTTRVKFFFTIHKITISDTQVCYKYYNAFLVASPLKQVQSIPRENCKLGPYSAVFAMQSMADVMWCTAPAIELVPCHSTKEQVIVQAVPIVRVQYMAGVVLCTRLEAETTKSVRRIEPRTIE